MWFAERSKWKSLPSLIRVKAQTRHKVGIKAGRLCRGGSHDYLFRVLTRNRQPIGTTRPRARLPGVLTPGRLCGSMCG
jgi:hypothetical protein